MPDHITATLPVVAPTGTLVVIDVLLVPLGFAMARQPEQPPVGKKKTSQNPAPPPTVLGSRFVPVIVIGVPMGPEPGDTLAIAGAGIIVTVQPLLLNPPTVTITFPVVAPRGTSAYMPVAVHDSMMVTGVPLKVMVLLPWVAPKPVPWMMSSPPIGT